MVGQIFALMICTSPPQPGYPECQVGVLEDSREACITHAAWYHPENTTRPHTVWKCGVLNVPTWETLR